MTTLNLQVGASSDDCVCIIDGENNVLDFTLAAPVQIFSGVGYAAGNGMRFTNITIPKGATIVTAYLLLCAYGDFTSTVVNSRISAEDVDNPSTFADDGEEFLARWANRTAAKVDWDNIETWEEDKDYNSPEIKIVIQEIIDREGWASGNAIVIFWEDFDFRTTNGAERITFSWESNPSFAPKLVIEYTPKVYEDLSGSSAGATSVSGFTRVKRAISGSSAGVCSVSGFTAIDRALAGLSQGRASVSGNLTIGLGVWLSGASAGIALVSGAIVRDLALAGISSGIASVSATLQRVRELSGAAAGIALVTGSIIISPGVWLSGASAGAALVSGSLSRIRVLAGISAGISSVSGLLGILKLLSGLSAGVATVTGRLGRKILAIRNLAAVRNLPPVRTLPWE
ncbi:hypothetical protein ES708_28104 [subsurface metagenome]